MTFNMAVVLLALVVATSAMTWHQFKEKYNREFDSIEDEAFRMSTFSRNMEFILNHHSEDYTVAMNQFGDMTHEEFLNLMKPRSSPVPQYNGPVFEQQRALPPSQDWRTSHCIGNVPNQGQCGASWAIVSTDMVAAYQCLQHHHALTPLSTQDLIDCAPGSMGCNGGTIEDAINYCISKGIDTLASYPSDGGQDSCKHDAGTVGAKCTEFHKITPPGNETDLTNVLAYTGPVACGIDASHTSFQFYNSGIYNEPQCSSSLIDHVVLAVGYGTTSGKDYYILQNSWGASWGMQGYMLLARGKKNMCGIATESVYVSVQ